MIRPIIALSLILSTAVTSHANTQLKNICRVKGQEENVLRGLGLVVGLNGTGEAGDRQTMRALAQAMEIMGSPLATSGPGGQRVVEELRNIKNAAMVMVTATVPATGARRGNQLDCFVSAINGKSLNGGQLAFASLMGPNTEDRKVYALCQGQIVIEDESQPMVGVIHNGCQMEADIYTKFVDETNATITLVLDKYHANFQTASDVARLVREKHYPASDDFNLKAGAAQAVYARDAANIIIAIPPQYAAFPVEFAADVLDLYIQQPEPEARVVINPRAGTIVISGNVKIGDVIASHRNIVIEANPSYSAVGTEAAGLPKLNELLVQLDALKVSTDDMIEIIRDIDRTGKLHGHLIIE